MIGHYKTKIYWGDSREVLKKFPGGCFNLIITSPPYANARKKHYDGIHPDEYVKFMLSFHDEFWRVLADDGSFVLNIKDKINNGVRHRYVWKTIEALSDLGWCCIDDYLWIKTNAMPGYWKNRFRDEWEYCFHMTKQKSFAMYQGTVMRPIGSWVEKRLANLSGKSKERHNSENQSGFGRNLQNWKDKDMIYPGNTITLPVVGKNVGHPAVFPIALPEFFIKLFTKQNDVILDPFAGSGSTGIATTKHGRRSVLIDNSIKYVKIMEERLKKYNLLTRLLFFLKYQRNQPAYIWLIRIGKNIDFLLAVNNEDFYRGSGTCPAHIGGGSCFIDAARNKNVGLAVSPRAEAVSPAASIFLAAFISALISKSILLFTIFSRCVVTFTASATCVP